MRKSRKNIIEMTHFEARRFLLKSESYVNSSLPSYINISCMLEKAEILLKNTSLENLSKSKSELSKHENVNHVILANKDGNYAWRPIELIHPIVYVDLVNTITDESNWNTLCNRVRELNSKSVVDCISLPAESKSNKSDKAETILNWWENLEQSQIKYSLDYEYCGHTDISNCYGSIYTHSVSWAVHSKAWAKTHRRPNQGIGNKIDAKIQYMRNGQTNGIPQGSVLMDFIAEIVLAYADYKLTDKLQEEDLSNFYIMRYRDDYRVFSNSKGDVELIIKLLSEILADLNMKLNANKTFISTDIIKDAVKPDKLYWDMKRSSIELKQFGDVKFSLGIQKHLIQIKLLADKYPHSGSIRRALTDIYKYRIENIENSPEDINQLISITIDIMVKNPNTIEHCVVILSKLVTLIEQDEIPHIIDKIIKKFDKTPNTNFVELWLQRLSLVHDREKEYKSRICQKVRKPDENTLWNSKWLKNGFDESGLINESYIEDMNITLTSGEIDLFANIYDSEFI
ncbi:RNA-directed DNA polymerase [Enterococcus sp. C71]|uniref:RNA-directed DNA polymerase n=1 Tax=Enterococcus TaxID=1350 RepID=UPI0034A0645D